MIDEKLLYSYEKDINEKKYIIKVIKGYYYGSNTPSYTAITAFNSCKGKRKINNIIVSESGETEVDAKEKCEKSIEIKEKILSGDIHMISDNEAEELVRKNLVEYINNNKIPKIIKSRLCSSWLKKGKEYIYYLEYLDPEKVRDADLTNDLESGKAELMLTIKVDKEFSTVEIIESSEIKW